MPDDENNALHSAPPPPVIESGMRSGQGDESGSADTLTIGEKYDADAPAPPDAATDPEGAEHAVHDAAAALGDPNYHPAGEN